MKTSESNLILFLSYKYTCLFLFILNSITIWFESGSIEGDKVQLLIVGLIFLIGHLLISPIVFRAKVSHDHIELRQGMIIRWEEIRNLYRVGGLYFLKVQGRKWWYLFPRQQRLFTIWPERARDTNMDQLIQLKIKNSQINDN